jgi:hypothetical protein
VGGGAWPFLVGGAICLVNSDNERDSVLLTRRVNPAGRGRGAGGFGRRRPRSRPAGPVSPNAFARRPRRSSGADVPSASRGPRARTASSRHVRVGGVKPLGACGVAAGVVRASVPGSAVKCAASAAVAGGSRYVTRATAGSQELKLFLEGQAADENSRTRLSDNRSVMPLDVLGRTRATLKESACVNVPGPTGFRVTR